MANLELRVALHFESVVPQQYDNQKTTSRCKAEHQKSGYSCTTKENDCASAEKDTHGSRQTRGQSCPKETDPIKIKIGSSSLSQDFHGLLAQCSRCRAPASLTSGRLSFFYLYLIYLPSPTPGARLPYC